MWPVESLDWLDLEDFVEKAFEPFLLSLFLEDDLRRKLPWLCTDVDRDECLWRPYLLFVDPSCVRGIERMAYKYGLIPTPLS